MAASGLRMYGTGEVVTLLEDDDRFEAEFGNLDLEGESEDEFEAVGRGPSEKSKNEQT